MHRACVGCSVHMTGKTTPLPQDNKDRTNTRLPPPPKSQAYDAQLQALIHKLGYKSGEFRFLVLTTFSTFPTDLSTLHLG